MRIVGLILLGLMLFNGLFRTVSITIALVSGRFANAAPGYGPSLLLSTIAITAIVAFFFLRLLKKTD